MVMLVILVLGAAAILLSSLSSSGLRMERDKITSDALAQAKDALIGYSIKEASIIGTGYLLVPDTGWITNDEGVSEGTIGATDISVIGKFPWKTLGTAPQRDAHGECLWYIVSGRFKSNPKTAVFNWDTPGQIDIIDTNGNSIINNVAALIVAPGSVLDSQNRSLVDPALTQCRGNYNAINYLDAFNNVDAIAGELNYFVGSTNNRLAQNTNNKRFVQASNDHYNDKFLYVTTDDIFRPIIRRSDFRDQISALLDDVDFIPHLRTVSITGPKGNGSLDCTVIGNTFNETFCNNWKEMLLLTQLPAGSSNITIDDTTYTTCTRVLIFGGQKSATQARFSATDKANPTNYLEPPNLAAFDTPSAVSSSFTGTSTFDANNPSADLLRCLL